MNKRGQIGFLPENNVSRIILFFIIIAFIIGVGLIAPIIVGTFKIVVDNVIPEVNDINIGNSSASTGVAVATQVTSAVSTLLPWILGALYMVTLIGCIGLAYAFRLTGEKYLAVLYILLGILVVLGSILVSNAYQNVYNSSGALGDQLQDMVLMSWLMLYSPLVITIIVFLGGILIFVGFGEEALA